jgi:hypothetical protein
MYPRVVEHNGGDARIGRKLYLYFLRAGIPDPGLRLVQSLDATGEGKTLPLLTLQATGEAIVNAALASAASDTIINSPRILQVWTRR